MRVFAPQSGAQHSSPRHDARPAGVRTTPLLFSIMQGTDNKLQRKSGCACGGGCPGCAEEKAAPAIQTKLTLSNPGDPYEQEADRVADQIMRMPDASVQRQCESCAKGPGSDRPDEPNLSIQRYADTQAGATMVASDFTNHLGPGQPLDSASRSYFEPRFGCSFGDVRVHTDARASESARAVNALAYTVGRDIVFSESQYAPTASEGRRLLAHELTHVVQQNGIQSRSRTPTDMGSVTPARQEATASNAGAPLVTTLNGAANISIQRYHHHSSCTSSNLTGIVWPGDREMRLMVAKAIRVLRPSPIDPSVTALFPKYFMTATPPIPTILSVFNAVQAVITADNYTWECENDCTAVEAAYVRHRLRYFGINPNLHLCTNHMTGYTLPCNASLMLHEMTHYASHLSDHATGCGSCNTTGCPSSLSASDALDNTYSYANFAYEIYPMAV